MTDVTVRSPGAVSPPDDAPLPMRIARAVSETARSVPGVHHLGSTAARAADTVRERLGRSAGAAGVRVDTDDEMIDVSVALVVEYPLPVPDVVAAVRAQVRSVVRQFDPSPSRVTIRVTDVHGPFDREADAADAVDRAADTVQAGVGATRDAATRATEAARRAASATADAAESAAAATADAAAVATSATVDASSRAAGSTRDAARATRDAARRTAEAARATAAQADADAVERAALDDRT